MIELGAGTAVPTVRRQSERCMQLGAKLIRINPREYHGPMGIIDINESARTALWLINDRLRALTQI